MAIAWKNESSCRENSVGSLCCEIQQVLCDQATIRESPRQSSHKNVDFNGIQLVATIDGHSRA